MQLNGVLPTMDQVKALALTNYGHFTSMLAEDGRVRGLSLHLQRLARDCRTICCNRRPSPSDNRRALTRSAMACVLLSHDHKVGEDKDPQPEQPRQALPRRPDERIRTPH